MGPYIPFLVIGGVAAFVALLAYLNYRAERLRMEALRGVADALGFAFLPGGDATLQAWLERFHLFSQGRGKVLSSVLRGKTRDLDVAVFDYKYTVGSGKHSHTHRTTVICFQAAGLDLPAFQLRPEGFWHWLGASLFGLQDINFDTHPAFSKAYLLKGKDEAAIRKAFAPDVLDHFETLTGVSTEADGDTLVFYRHSARVDPAKVREFMEEGFAVLGLFRKSGEAAA